MRYGPANSRIGLETVTAGSERLLLWQELRRVTKGSPASEITVFGVHVLQELYCCLEMCWMGSAHPGIHACICLQGCGGMRLFYNYPI